MSANGEFEREPVPQSALLGFKSFPGMYAGEHCAGTELMLGPLFVAAGVSARDLIVGLLLGNALAVLSWMLLCAPIAVRARLTLYYQLEKICGRKLVTVYNIANGVMFCFLAGSMITVSATAVGVMFPDISMPTLESVRPETFGWVAVVLVLGVLISVVAAYGYDAVSRFANIASPWMVLVFLAFGLIGLRQFLNETGTEVHSAGDLWHMLSTEVWTGGEPLPGSTKFHLAHVIFFAWFCNMAMHIGMSDLSVFRFAKHSWYGVATASGMYVGHFMAWAAAAMLFALQLHQTRADEHLQQLLVEHGKGVYAAEDLADAPLTADMVRAGMEIENRLVEQGVMKEADKKVKAPTPLPGQLAFKACGIAGLICVIIAGWTTANPTIYRAGLAFQAIVPRVSRYKVTIATGLLATVAGMFPAIAMQLLSFVALYGLILMPMGAVVFADFWLLRKLGLSPYYAERVRISVNWPAGVAWVATVAICVGLVMTGNPLFQIYFVSLPGWFIATAIYIGLSKVMQRPVAAAP
ncbi:MAG: hypothetical protein KDA44_05490 [Planctomycetales bacterium]|nr:hypothetical protein [Planctomycetales bacterium]